MPRFKNLQGWLNWQESLHPKVIDLGLDRSQNIYNQLNPDNIKPVTVTVAGTNGKGSCVAFLEAIYTAQGYKVGAYTSPHILNYNERIKINGQPVDDEAICRSFERIDNIRKQNTLSYFEFGTLAALDIFIRSKVDIQLLEVGLGGRLDAVNIVDADVALITTICIDHVDWLGETREAIGREKAGIFRSGIPAVIGDTDPPASLFEVARQKNTPLLCFGQDFNYQIHPDQWTCLFDNQQINALPLPALEGSHQLRNAATVITALEQLQDSAPVTEAAIKEGLQNVQLNGRFQLIDSEIPVLLDVGHNPQAVRTLVEYLNLNFPNAKIHAVFSMMKDKDISGVIEIVKPLVDHWYLAPLSNPRAAGLELLKECFVGQNIKHVNSQFGTFIDAFLSAKQSAKQGELILVFGSFFMVSEYLTHFH